MYEVSSSQLSEPNQVAKIVPWDLDFRQISRGSGQTDLTVRVGQLIQALSIKMHSRVHQVGEAPADMITFGVPQPGYIQTWLGVQAPEHALVCFGSGQEFDGVSSEGFQAVTLSISQDDLNDLAADFGIDLNADVFRPGVFDLKTGSRPHQLLARKSAAFTLFDGSRFDPDAENDVGLALLLTAAAAQVKSDIPSQRLRDRAIARALEVIDATTDNPPNIRDLCKKSGASWPTLHRAFTERFDIGPKAYISIVRLNRARSALLAAGKQTKVSDVANHFGFWHLGQFAKDYQKMFNSLPSKELKT